MDDSVEIVSTRPGLRVRFRYAETGRRVAKLLFPRGAFWPAADELAAIEERVPGTRARVAAALRSFADSNPPADAQLARWAATLVDGSTRFEDRMPPGVLDEIRRRQEQARTIAATVRAKAAAFEGEGDPEAERAHGREVLALLSPLIELGESRGIFPPSSAAKPRPRVRRSAGKTKPT